MIISTGSWKLSEHTSTTTQWGKHLEYFLWGTDLAKFGFSHKSPRLFNNDSSRKPSGFTTVKYQEVDNPTRAQIWRLHLESTPKKAVGNSGCKPRVCRKNVVTDSSQLSHVSMVIHATLAALASGSLWKPLGHDLWQLRAATGPRCQPDTRGRKQTETDCPALSHLVLPHLSWLGGGVNQWKDVLQASHSSGLLIKKLESATMERILPSSDTSLTSSLFFCRGPESLGLLPRCCP